MFPPAPYSTATAPQTTLSTSSVLCNLRGGQFTDRRMAQIDYGEQIEAAYGWCVNLGAPSALIAGAVVATLYENMHSGDLNVVKTDTPVVRFGKIFTRLLLLSAFAMETISIFVTTVTGTMLLSRSPSDMVLSQKVLETPLQWLRENFEFEYLTARVTFLQGLLHWLAAIAVGHILPSPEDNTVDAVDKFIACSLGTLMLLMVSFYNNHMNFYRNYWDMVCKWLSVTWHRYFIGWAGHWPPRPISLLLVPSLIVSLYYGYEALLLRRSDIDGSCDRFQGKTKRTVMQVRF